MDASDNSVSLREYVDSRFTDIEKFIAQALANQKEAVFVAETNAEKWRQSANEWRGAMDDREGNFVKVGEFNLLLAQVKEIKDTISTSTGRGQGWEAGWKLLTSLASLIAVAVAVYVAMQGS